jgi:hypothetical protein
VVRLVNAPAKAYNRALSECFGESTVDNRATELTHFVRAKPMGLQRRRLSGRNSTFARPVAVVPGQLSS